MASSVIKKIPSKFEHPDIRVSSDGSDSQENIVPIGKWQAYFGILHHPYSSNGGVLIVNFSSTSGHVWTTLESIVATTDSNYNMHITMPSPLYLDLYHIES